MSTVNALINLSTPGRPREAILKTWRKVFESHLGKNSVTEADTVAGWGKLDQDWLEIRCHVETSYGWCQPICLTEDEWTLLYNMLENGSLIMMVHYIESDGSLTPHH